MCNQPFPRKRRKPQCFGHFMENVGNPNCGICPYARACYEEWNRQDKITKKKKEEAEKPWYEKKPLTEMFPEACERCEREET